MARPKKQQPKGLGDVVENITKATGIKAAVEKFSEVTGIDCGCDERRKKWNELYPLSPKVKECLNETDKEYLRLFFERNQQTIYPIEQRQLMDIYLRVFDIKLEHTSCSSCWRTYVKNLKMAYEN